MKKKEEEDEGGEFKGEVDGSSWDVILKHEHSRTKEPEGRIMRTSGGGRGDRERAGAQKQGEGGKSSGRGDRRFVSSRTSPRITESTARQTDPAAARPAAQVPWEMAVSGSRLLTDDSELGIFRHDS